MNKRERKFHEQNIRIAIATLICSVVVAPLAQTVAEPIGLPIGEYIGHKLGLYPTPRPLDINISSAPNQTAPSIIATPTPTLDIAECDAQFSNVPCRYITQPRDTCSTIAIKAYGTQNNWHVICEINIETITSHWLHDNYPDLQHHYPNPCDYLNIGWALVIPALPQNPSESKSRRPSRNLIHERAEKLSRSLMTTLFQLWNEANRLAHGGGYPQLYTRC